MVEVRNMILPKSFLINFLALKELKTCVKPRVHVDLKDSKCEVFLYSLFAITVWCYLLYPE